MCKRQSRLKDRIQSQRRERQKIKRASTAPPKLSSENADFSLAEVALLAVMQKDALNSKKEFDKETMLAAAGNSEGIYEVMKEYDTDAWKSRDGEQTVMDIGLSGGDAQSKEEVLAMKIAKRKLQNDVMQEKHLNDQLKASSLKQVQLFSMQV